MTSSFIPSCTMLYFIILMSRGNSSELTVLVQHMLSYLPITLRLTVLVIVSITLPVFLTRPSSWACTIVTGLNQEMSRSMGSKFVHSTQVTTYISTINSHCSPVNTYYYAWNTGRLLLRSDTLVPKEALLLKLP
jgi:hypothetical protein